MPMISANLKTLGRTGRITAATAALLLATQAAQAFECPTLAAVTFPDDYTVIAPLLPPGDDLLARENIIEAVNALRGRGTPDDIILNSLFAAYCPRIAANAALSDEQKNARAEAFLTEASRVVFASGV